MATCLATCCLHRALCSLIETSYDAGTVVHSFQEFVLPPHFDDFACAESSFLYLSSLDDNMNGATVDDAFYRCSLCWAHTNDRM